MIRSIGALYYILGHYADAHVGMREQKVEIAKFLYDRIERALIESSCTQESWPRATLLAFENWMFGFERIVELRFKPVSAIAKG